MSKRQVGIISDSLTTLARKKEVFETLCASEYYGWEKWLQVELAVALHKQGTPEFEYRFEYDEQMPKPKSKKDRKTGLIDIKFTPKNFQQEWFTAIEIKINSTEKGLRSVLSDLIKLGAMKSEKWKFRCVTAVFVHDNRGMNNGKFKELKLALQQSGRNGVSARVVPIKHTSFEAIVFGWETGAIKKMKRDGYLEWLKKVKRIYAKYGIHPNMA